MTRELKLALIVGFSLVLVVTVLISDHLSKARQVKLAGVESSQPALTSAPIAEPMPVAIAPPAPEPKPRVVASTAGATPKPLMEPEVITISQSREHPVSPVGRANVPTVSNESELGTGQKIVDNTASHERALESDNLQPPVSVSGVSPTPAPGEKTHTVVEGDSLYKIAKFYYGDPSQFTRIAEANADRVKGEKLKLGSKLRIPAKLADGKPVINDPLNAPVAAKVVQDSSKAGAKTDVKADSKKAKYGTYTVKKGDTLNDISRRVLGSPQRTNELIRLNESSIADEDNVPIGTVLKIPLS